MVRALKSKTRNVRAKGAKHTRRNSKVSRRSKRTRRTLRRSGRKSRKPQRGGGFTGQALRELIGHAEELVREAKAVVAMANDYKSRGGTFYNYLYGSTTQGDTGIVWELQRQLETFTSWGGTLEQMKNFYEDMKNSNPDGSDDRWQVNEEEFMKYRIKVSTFEKTIEEVTGWLEYQRQLTDEKARAAQQQLDEVAAAETAAAAKTRDDRSRMSFADWQRGRFSEGAALAGNRDPTGYLRQPSSPKPKTWSEWLLSTFF